MGWLMLLAAVGIIAYAIGYWVGWWKRHKLGLVVENDLSKRLAELRAENKLLQGLEGENVALRMARDVALMYAADGVIDGEHHKMWVIDQMVRSLLGHKYEEWVQSCEDEWDEGIAP